MRINVVVMFKDIPAIKIIAFVMLIAVPALPGGADASQWLFFDDGEAVHPGSSLRYQGVRFSLPDEGIRAPLLQIALFYATGNAFCPVKIHITDHTRSVRLTDRISLDAVNGWNYLDLSLLGLSVPHNFYVILENKKCGFLMMDNQEVSSRSFKGNYLKSMTTRLTHDLLMRAKIGDIWDVPMRYEWNISWSERVILKQSGSPTQTRERELRDKVWKLYADNSFVSDGKLYGIWKQKKQKFQVSLDFEEVRAHLMESLPSDFGREVADVIVTKIVFTGKIADDGMIAGILKIFAKVSFFDTAQLAKVKVEKHFIGLPASSGQ